MPFSLLNSVNTIAGTDTLRHFERLDIPVQSTLGYGHYSNILKILCHFSFFTIFTEKYFVSCRGYK